MNWLDTAQECRLGEFLSARGSKAHLLAPASFAAEVRALAPAAVWTSSVVPQGIPAGARWVFVHHPHDEPAALRQAAAQVAPGVRLRGLLQHVIPALVTNGQNLPADWEQLPQPVQRFAVVCTPRTGSTFLCELLQAGGLGAAKEHLRGPLVQVLRSGQVDENLVFDIILRTGTSRGVFGTKLISHFLFWASPAGAAQRLQCLAAQGFGFIHLSRDLVSQAVSKYLAGASGVWHQRGAVGEGASQKLAEVPYDFPALLRLYQEMLRETELLEAALASLNPALVMRLDYAQLVADPMATMAECARFIGAETQTDEARLGRLPVRLSSGLPSSVAMQAQFTAQLAIQGGSMLAR